MSNDNTYNTLHGAIISFYRRSGNSIRQVDAAIQALYDGKTVIVRDHSNTGKRADRHLFDMLRRRLETEHNLSWLHDNKYIEVNGRDYTIRLTDAYFKYMKEQYKKWFNSQTSVTDHSKYNPFA